MIVTHREVIIDLVGSAADVHLMVDNTGVVVEHFVLPVGALAVLIRIGIDRSLSCVDKTFVHHHSILGGVEHIAVLPWVLPAVREVVVDVYSTLLAALGGDEDDTVGSTCTVDGARGSILQYLNALDVAGVQIVDAALDGHTINDVERVTIIDSTDTTDTNL